MKPGVKLILGVPQEGASLSGSRLVVDGRADPVKSLTVMPGEGGAPIDLRESEFDRRLPRVR